MSPRRVAVVGGGYAGMAAALDLAEAGLNVTVFETAPELGGRARRVTVHGETLDNGQHILSGAYSALLDAMQRAGSPKAGLRRTRLQFAMPPDFEMKAPRLPAPLHLGVALLGARGLTWGERFAAIRLMRHLQSRDYCVESGQTVASLLAATRQPAATINHLFGPLAVSALNTPITTASAQVFANVLRDALDAKREASDLLLPQTDLSALFPEPVAHIVRARGGAVRTGERVRAIRCERGRFAVVSAQGDEPFDRVVLAIGAHQFGAIDLPATISAPELGAEAIITVYMKFDARVRLPLPMLGQANGTAHWFFDRRALCNPHADDGLIAAVISAASPDLKDRGLVETLLRELASHVANIPPAAWSKIIMEKFATFACTPSTQAKRPGTQTAIPGLLLAGDYLASDYPATLESAVRSGQAAARALIELELNG
jgi:squalene-associated FAD-dependent desaturase